jgi:hypothetical protein
MRYYPFVHKTFIALLTLLMVGSQGVFMLHSTSHIHHGEVHSLSAESQLVEPSFELHAIDHTGSINTHFKCCVCTAHQLNGSAHLNQSDTGIPHLTVNSPIQSNVDTIVSPHLGNHLSRAPPA